MTGRSGKRPMRPLSPRQKLVAIHRVHDGESKAAVARDLGVPESTLRGWCKNELKIVESIRTSSSPETDESDYYEMRRRKRKRSENAQTAQTASPAQPQPFNLSVRPSTCTSLPSTSGASSYSPNSENRYSLDLSKTAIEDKTAPLDLIKPKPNGSINKVTVPKTSPTAAAVAAAGNHSDRNKAELARLSVELGLNRPEMFMSNPSKSSANISDLSNMLTAHWNQLLLQQQAIQQAKKIASPVANTTNGVPLLTTVTQAEKQPSTKLPNDKLSVDESVRYWLNSSTSPHVSPNSVYPTSLSTPSTGNTTSPMTGMTPEQNAWIFKWYKTMLASQYANAQYPTQLNQPNPEKPILYQQLTKVKQEKNDAENLTWPEDRPGAKNITNTKARAVLDTLLLNNNNICLKTEEGESVSQNEAVTHGEKFLKWLESCSEPSVTAMQIIQFRSLLTNVKASADRKNGGVQIKAKVKRK